MGWPVNSSNSKKFMVDGVEYALACMPDADIGGVYTLGIFFKTPAGDWNCPVTPDSNGILDNALTNEKIMATGSTANYIQSVLPLATARLKQLLAIVKPDIGDKGACVGYDFAYPNCINYEPTTMTFSLAMTPPLPHAK